MDRGTDFLKSQINNAVMQHQTFVDNLADHAQQAEDERFRALCASFLPRMRQHQSMLEAYQHELGAEAGTAKKMLGKALGAARDLADAVRESDMLRLIGDIVTARQSQDTFATFRTAGLALGLQRLAQVGEHCEREHEDYIRQANALVAQLFVEHVRAGDTTALGIAPGAGASIRTEAGPPGGSI